LDGGIVTAPSFGVWDTAGEPLVAENNGITPDIEIEHDPEVVRKGRDPQLEKAIEQILTELDKNPPKKLVRPQSAKYQTLR
jgi:tricorn protease